MKRPCRASCPDMPTKYVPGIRCGPNRSNESTSSGVQPGSPSQSTGDPKKGQTGQTQNIEHTTHTHTSCVAGVPENPVPTNTGPSLTHRPTHRPPKPLVRTPSGLAISMRSRQARSGAKAMAKQSRKSSPCNSSQQLALLFVFLFQLRGITLFFGSTPLTLRGLGRSKTHRVVGVYFLPLTDCLNGGGPVRTGKEPPT